MFVFIGFNLNEEFKNIHNEAKKIGKVLEFNDKLFIFPMHISLKISFEIKDEILNDVLETLTLFFKQCNPFIIFIKGIEKDGEICWIRTEENKRLNKLHDDINNLLLEKYQIPLHEYDLDYKFHSTLFIDQDITKIDKAYELIKDYPLPNEVIPEEIMIGVSSSGSIGSYEIIRRIFL